MKIRTGFVSNSSSSSFCIYGASVDKKQLIKIGKQTDTGLEYIEIWKMEGVDIGGVEVISGQYDEYFIGRSWTSIGDDETGSEFKKSVDDKVKDLLGEDKKCCTYEDGWYDG